MDEGGADVCVDGWMEGSRDGGSWESLLRESLNGGHLDSGYVYS